MIKPRRRRCLCCQKLFSRDPRLRHRQKYCSEPECRAASKRSSQRRWLRKPENHEYFRGEQHVDRVQAWRAQNPGYGRKPRLIGEPLGRLAAKIIAPAECAGFVRRYSGTEVAKMILGVDGRESERVIAGNRPSPMGS